MTVSRIALAGIRVADVMLLPAVAVAGLVLRLVRRLSLGRMPASRGVLKRIGLLPVRNHYYEPYVDVAALRFPLNARRPLPGIDWNLNGQLQLLEQLTFAGELRDLGSETGSNAFRFNNGSFESGDAEFLYQVIRACKPRRVIEVGSGHSTRIANRALRRNQQENAAHAFEHICIEPYENPWLESLGVQVLRQRVEEVDPGLFARLAPNDLLFIDSSHVIRPQGDVVVEYLEILPLLKPGVIVHVHDIFSPRDYLKEWIADYQWLWNEQYLLEAFLTGNPSWEVIGALNLLHHEHRDRLQRVCPYLTADREPGSFYMRKLA
jgi:methyltransferase family protein